MENNDPFHILDKEKEIESHRIEELEKKLYSRQNEIPHKDRTMLHPKKTGFRGSESWEEGDNTFSFSKRAEKSNGSPFVKFFIFSVIFFLIATGIAGYSLFSKRIVVSPDNVNVSVFGPVSAKGGDDVNIQVLIENKNTVPINSVQLTGNFPSGSRNIGDTGKELPRTVKSLDSIAAGETRTETVKALILGGENQKKEISFDIRFRVEGSDALYTKNRKFTLNLTSTPLSFTASLLKEITPKQDFTLGVDITSNSQAVLMNPVFKMDYPQGFVFEGANPAPTENDNVWLLGTMNFGEVKHIDVKGKLLGDNGQQKIFHLSSGIGTDNNQLAMSTVFGTSLVEALIAQPFLGIDILVNGSNEPSPIIKNWEAGNIDIGWTNNLLDKINNGEIAVSLKGDTIDKKSIVPIPDGLYDSISNTITWDERAVPDLALLSPGQKGTVSFGFSLIPYSAAHSFKNPTITVSTNVKGNRINESNVPQDVKFSSSKTIKISSQIQFASFGTHYGIPISNTGPIPPRVGQATTYTITWKAINTANDVSNAQISATIPLSVQWTGQIFPNGSAISYDETSKKVTWNIGNMKAGVGYSEDPDEVSFQVALLPGLSELNKTPMLLSSSVFTATDNFTGASLSAKAVAVTTVISGTDPKITEKDTQVKE